MRLVVARIGRAHGIRGEVTVRGAHRRPRASGSSPGRCCTSATVARRRNWPPPDCRPADPGRGPRPQRHAAARLRRGRRPHRGRGAARTRCSRPRSPTRSRRPGRVVRPPAGRAGRASTRDGALLGEVVAVEHLPAQDLLVVRRPDGARAAGAVRDRDRARGRRRRRPGRHRRRRPGCSTWTSRDRGRRCGIDVVTIFPEYLAPLGAVADRPGPARRAARPARCTTCATSPTTGTAPSTTPRTAAAPAW